MYVFLSGRIRNKNYELENYKKNIKVASFEKPQKKC